MSKVLLAGLSIRYRARLQGRHTELEFEVAGTGAEAIELGNSEDLGLIIIDESLSQPGVEEVLGELKSKRIPTIYCCNEVRQGDVLKNLVRQFGVSLVLHKPLDPEELVRHTALMMAVPIPAGKKSADESEMAANLQKIWDKYKPVNIARVERVKEILMAVDTAPPDEEIRREAEREAHKLAGGLGTFGFQKAALLSRELERGLQSSEPLNQQGAHKLLSLVNMILQDIEGGQASTQKPAQAPTEEPTPEGEPGELSARLILLVSEDEEAQTTMQALAQELGAELEVTSDWLRAREVWMSGSPELVVLDLAEDVSGERWTLYRDLGTRLTHVPVLGLLSKKNLANAEAFSSLVGRSVLLKPLQPGQLDASARKILARGQSLQTRILAVDDDPLILDALKALLTPLRMQVNTLEDPLDFWDALDKFTPDVVILDIDMPVLSGVEICRSIRSNERWYQLPIIFLSAYNDSATINRLFLAGADDYVSKPFVGPELVTRISNRLARSGSTSGGVAQAGGFDSRTRSMERIRNHMLHAEKEEESLAVALLEIDKFNQWHQELGKAKADRIMEQIGRRLGRTLRSNDVVARWGKAELLLCLTRIDKSVAANRLEHLLQKALGEPYSIDGEPKKLPLTASVGIAQFPDDSKQLAQLVRACDTAMSVAKGSGGNRIVMAQKQEEQVDEVVEVDLVAIGESPAETREALTTLHSRGYSLRNLPNAVPALEQLCSDTTGVQGRVVLLQTLEGVDFEKLQTLGRLSRIVALTESDQQLADCFDQGLFDAYNANSSTTVQIKRLERALEG